MLRVNPARKKKTSFVLTVQHIRWQQDARPIGQLRAERRADQQDVDRLLLRVVQQIVLDGARRRPGAVHQLRAALNGAGARVDLAHLVAVVHPHLAEDLLEARHRLLLVGQAQLAHLFAEHLQAEERLHAVGAVQAVQAVGANRAHLFAALARADRRVEECGVVSM